MAGRKRAMATPRSTPAQAGSRGVCPTASAAAVRDGEASGTAELEQQQFELMLMIRSKIDSAEALLTVASTVQRLVAFVASLGELAARASVERVHIVQDLLLRLQGGQLSFDSQAGVDAIPMHQAKVLDRSARLPRELQLEVLAGGQLASMLSDMAQMRTLLKVKVEDGNDLLMAENTLRELTVFFRRLHEVAAQRQCDVFTLFASLQ